MREVLRHIYPFFLVIICVLGMTSCSSHDSDVEDPAFGDEPFLVLRVNSLLAAANATANGGIEEKIKSLRVIILNEVDGQCAIEYNELIGLSSNTRGFAYEFIRRTIVGKKKLYFIANEESVGTLHFNPSNELPNDLPTNLKNLLNSYIAGGGNGKEFEQVLNAIYFSPNYTPNNNNEIYLPYTSYYEAEMKEKGGNLEQKMYLVPVATKFVFRFYNFRSNPVAVNGISISSINRDNYLMPHVGEAERNKKLDGTEYYWIDWLAEVSKESHSKTENDGNVSFNQKYGWISDYAMPTTNTTTTTFVKSGNVPNRVNENTPGTLSFGPYYCPESNNNDQNYYFTLDLKDAASNSEPSSSDIENVLIENLNALFRNTCVIINITMREEDIYEYEIVVDVDPWDEMELNPNVGLDDKDGVTDNDPWDESNSNPNAGLDDKDGVTDNDPWDEKDLNPKFGLNEENK